MQQLLIQRALLTAVAAGLGQVEIWCAPDCSHPFFHACAQRHGIALQQQCDGDLGLRMRHALEEAARAGSAALLIGSDCPALTPEYLRNAAAALAGGCEAVYGPAEDGGYGLVGLARRAPDRIFDGIAWGTAGVMRETRLRLAAAGWHWREMPLIWDVDRPEDLPRLSRYLEQV